MKKSFLYAMMAFVFAISFTACNNDDNDSTSGTQQHDPASDEDQTEVTAYDALEWLQNSIVVIGENGEVARRIYGEMLDPSDTTILSISVEDYAMAERIFLDWVAPMKEQNVETVEGGYIYKLTDSYSNSQGSVEFKQIDGSEGILAKMSVTASTALKAVSEVRFISKDAWPENASQTQLYKAGEVYTIKDAPFLNKLVKSTEAGKSDYELPYMRVFPKDLEFYCIQGNDKGNEAILVWLSPDSETTYDHGCPDEYVEKEAYKHLATLPEAQKVLKYYIFNYESWENMIDYMKGRGQDWDWHFGRLATGNEEFLLNSYDAANKTIKCLDLDSKKGKICNVSINSWFKYRYMLVRIVPPYTEE